MLWGTKDGSEIFVMEGVENIECGNVTRPWLCMGDFNEILLGCEKQWGLARAQVCMDAFTEA